MLQEFITTTDTLNAINNYIYEKRLHTNTLEHFDYLHECEVNGKTIVTFGSIQMSEKKIEVRQDIRWMHNKEYTNKHFQIIKIVQGTIRGCEKYSDYICIVRRIR